MSWRPPERERPPRDERGAACLLDDVDRGVFFFVVGEQWQVQWMGEDGSHAFRRDQDIEEHRR